MDKCPKCAQLEDITHYMFECQGTQLLWQQLSRWWAGITNQNITFSNRDVMLGLEKRQVKIRMQEQLNEIIMATKWKIHANKQMGENTCLYQILHSINQMINLYELIANRNHKIQKHEEKWRQIKDYLT
jgi:hypothetical protein